MKKTLFKPGFEFIFSLCLLAVLGLPPLVFGQKQQKDLQISINNGDTTINGKNIKDLSATERKDALKDINQITVINNDGAIGKPHKVFMVTTKGNKAYLDSAIVVGPQNVNGNMYATGGRIKTMRFKMKRGENDSTLAFNYRMDGDPREPMKVRDFRIERDDEGRGPRGFGRRNTQNFVYTNTDNDGINTRVSYHVSDHPATFDYDAGKHEIKQQEILYITDLNIVPEFSAGKTLIMFSLPTKAAAEVQFKDDKGNLLWSEKALNGSFSKSFGLGLNGMYFLQIKQGNKIAVKEIMKD